jgi:uncharacterized protein
LPESISSTHEPDYRVSILYNLLMAAVDVAAAWLLREKRTGRRWCSVLSGAAAAAMILAVVLGFAQGDHFAVFRLAAYGIYLHGVLLLAASGGLLWQDRRRLACGSLAIAAVLLGLAADAFLVEPHWLEVTHRQLVSARIARPLKIVVVADIQTDRVGDFEREVFRRVAEEKPDLLLFAGDYVQVPWAERGELWAELRPLIRAVVDHGLAPGGRAFAVRGNVDWHDWDKMFDGLGVQTVNARESIELDGQLLSLTCLGWIDSMQTALAIARPRADRFHVVMGHSPNYALGQIDADLLLAGHTHGGQVRLPLLGPVATNCSLPRRLACGVSHLAGGAWLVVSRGTGMERGPAPRLRFLCRPELVILDLEPQRAKP